MAGSRWSDVSVGSFYSDQENIVRHIYEPGFRHAGKYIRDTGSFSSNVYHLMGFELLDFLLRHEENHMTLICSMNIRPQDIDALFDSISLEEARKYLISELNRHVESGDEISSPVKLLVSLLATGKMSLIISLRNQDSSSTAHDHAKAGIFEIPSTGEILCFQGSVNETYPALDPQGNNEQYSVWHRESENSENHSLWILPIINRLTKIAGTKRPTKVADGTLSVPLRFLERSDFPSMSEDEWDPNNHTNEAKTRSKKTFDKFQNIIDEKTISGKSGGRSRKPSGPLPPPAPSITAREMTLGRPHQSDAIAAWEKAGRRGILQHATGSGKTITSIAAIEEHLAKSEDNFSILVLPYKALQKQWKKELAKFGIRTIEIGGNSIPKLQEIVLKQLRSGTFNENCVLNIIQDTFTREEAASSIIKGSTLFERCLFVFDECHHVGRSGYSRFVQAGIRFPSVLGLSATPFSPIEEDLELGDNWWDETKVSRFHAKAIERNEQIRNLMGEIVDTFDLSDAIEKGYLTPYEYNIHHAEMTEQEQADYDEYRKLIPKQMHYENPSAIHLSRSIVKSISGKIKILREIVESNYKKGQHWLIYCSHEDFLDSAKEVLIELGLEWWEYTSHNEDSRDIHMSQFEEHGGLMLAVKCLDEGVDIPKITHGIILSSSTVEREFIQRRGRMLRSAEGKKKAVIFDAVSIPHIGASRKSIESIMKHEISRTTHFENDAMNKEELQIILKSLNETFDIRVRHAEGGI